MNFHVTAHTLKLVRDPRHGIIRGLTFSRANLCVDNDAVVFLVTRVLTLVKRCIIRQFLDQRAECSLGLRTFSIDCYHARVDLALVAHAVLRILHLGDLMTSFYTEILDQWCVVELRPHLDALPPQLRRLGTTRLQIRQASPPVQRGKTRGRNFSPARKLACSLQPHRNRGYAVHLHGIKDAEQIAEERTMSERLLERGSIRCLH